MENSEMYYALLYSTGAVGVCMIGLFSLGWFISVQNYFQQWQLALIFPIIFSAISFNALLSDRNVLSAEFDLNSVSGSDVELSTWIFRFATFFILGICIASLASLSSQIGKIKKEGLYLFLSFFLFYFTNVVLNNIFGTKPSFNQQFLYTLLIFGTIYLSRDQHIYFSTEATKAGLLLFLFLSGLAAFLIPKIALQENYASWLPNVNIRLWGLGSNPNSIGPLALIFLLLLMYQPFKQRWIQYAAIWIGLSVLLLAQSKTAWLATIIAFTIMGISKMYYSYLEIPLHKRIRSRFKQILPTITLGVIGVLFAAGFIIFDPNLSQTMIGQNNEELTTLTGRTGIWSVALDAWRNNPLFGYGSSIWSNEFREKIDMNFAFSAHNQFLQALSEAGIIGLVGLLVYLCTLLRYAYLANKASKGLSLALFSVLFIRSFTETPFIMGGIFTGEFVMHLFLFRLSLATNRHTVSARMKSKTQRSRISPNYNQHFASHKNLS